VHDEFFSCSYPAPVNGYYHPGDTVTFTYVINGYKPWSQTYLHGIEPKFGIGWDLSTLNTSITVVPVSQTGNWMWTTVNVPNQGPTLGYFYDGPPAPDGLPGNNKGDVGNSASQWIFTFRIATKPNCTNAEDLTIKINNYSDNESGSGIGIRCKNDPDYTFKAVLNCCSSPDISVVPELCPQTNSGNVSVTNTSIGIPPYTFSIYTTNGQFVISTNTVSSTFNTSLSQGEYIAYTQASSGCLSARTFNISSTLDLQIFQTNYACDPACGNAAAVFGQNQTSSYSYMWTPSNQTTQFAANLCPGNYTCVVTNTAMGCTDTLVIAVNGLPIDDATFFYVPTHNNVYYCQIDSTAGPEYIAQPGGTFSWTGPPNGIDPVTGDVLLIGTIPAGFYNITYNTPGPCPSSSQFTIEIRFAPPIPTVTGPSSVCLDQQPFTLTNTTIGFWTTAWDTSANATNPVLGNNYIPPILPTAGNYNVYALNVSADLCVSYPAIWPVTIFPLPVVWAGFDDTICPSHSTSLTGTGGPSYTWAPPAGLDNTTSPNPLATPTTTTTYTLTVQDNNGCRNADYVTVFVDSSLNCDIEIYNGFSPNGDLNNDAWIIEGIEALRDNRVSIFNRWGDLVWTEKDYDNSTVVWKGENQTGQMLPAGTYFYVIQVNGKPPLANWVELTR
jgi:gliding motility-associated-like protein